jgi:hypothetical protein
MSKSSRIFGSISGVLYDMRNKLCYFLAKKEEKFMDIKKYNAITPNKNDDRNSKTKHITLSIFIKPDLD